MTGRKTAHLVSLDKEARIGTLLAMSGGQKAALRQAIRERREKVGLSQEDLARRLNVSLRTLSRWELGQDKKDSVNANLERIAQALDTTAEDLTAKSLLIAGHPVDQPLDADEVHRAIDLALKDVRGQLLDLRAQIERVGIQTEELRKRLPPE